MKVSNRLENIIGGGSDGWEVFYRARQLKAAGADVIELTIGEHDIRTDPAILNHMHGAAIGGHTGYAMVPGTDVLRQTVAARIQDRTGVPTKMGNIMITPGGQAALFSAHVATMDAGDTGLFCDPYYATYPGVIRGAGGVPVAIPCDPANDFQPRKNDILNAYVPEAKSLLVNSPNNPTGVVYSKKKMEGIAEACIEKDLWLISDEVYDTQIWEGSHISPRQIPDMAQRTLVIGSLSKSHAMTGSRIGWICGPEDMITHLINLATHTNYGVAGFVQDAAVFALNAGQEFEDEIAAPFARRRKITLDILARQNILRAVPNSGAMYTMLDARATGLSGDEFANALLDAKGIAVMPGESFGKAAAGHIRVAMTIDDDAYAKALQTLCDFAKSVIDDGFKPQSRK